MIEMLFYQRYFNRYEIVNIYFNQNVTLYTIGSQPFEIHATFHTNARGSRSLTTIEVRLI